MEADGKAVCGESMSIETAVFIGYVTGFLMAWKVLPWIGKKLMDKEE